MDVHVSRSQFVFYNRFNWSVNHCSIVDRRKMAVNQVKLVFAQKDRPYCLYLHISKVLSDASVPTCTEG